LAISSRRYQFLQTLSHITKERKKPAHYVEVAKRLSVSKWTAYDMMWELAKDGLVKVSYATTPMCCRGRSQVLFEPTEKGLNLLSSRDTATSNEDNWPQVAKNLLSRVKKVLSEGRDVTHLLNNLQHTSRLAYCAALLAVLIIEFKKKELDFGLLQGILYASSKNEVTLALSVGLLAGSLLVKDAFKIIPGLNTKIQRFFKEVSQLEDSHKTNLIDFAKKVVYQVNSA